MLGIDVNSLPPPIAHPPSRVPASSTISLQPHMESRAELDVSAFFESRAVRYCQLSAAVLIVYEYLLEFGNEIDLFWRKGRRWSVAKCLFLFSRYFSMGFITVNAYFMMDEKPSLEFPTCVVCCIHLRGWGIDLTPRCTIFFHWQMTAISIQVIVVHCILGLRIYAMYARSKIILGIFVFLMSAETAIMGMLAGIQKEGVILTNEPSPGLFICADADPYHDPWIAYNWTTGLSVETILLFMSHYKAWSYYSSGGGGGLIRELTRDSVLYFLLIFWLYLFNQVVWLFNKITLTELGTGLFVAICSILSHRLLISVRAKHYGTGFESVELDLPSIHFQNTVAEAESLIMLSGM